MSSNNYSDYHSSEYGGDRGLLDSRYKKKPEEQSALNESAVERAAVNAQSRLKDTAQFADNLNKSGAKSSLQDAITMSREESNLARDREDDKARNLASESAKNRETDTFQKNAANASSNAGTFDSNATQKNVAEINSRTQQSGQQSSIEQAKISAQAQVSAAILGNRGSYGGYW